MQRYAVKAGLPLGTVHLVASGTANTYTGAATEVSRLTGTSTSVTLDPATVAALTSLKVKLAPEGTATVSGGAIHFPITGGVAVIHKDLSYKPGYIDGVLLGSAVKITPPGSTGHLDGTVASLTATAAAALNKAFGTTALKAGIELGVVHIIAS